jgi:hypothetical protein
MQGESYKMKVAKGRRLRNREAGVVNKMKDEGVDKQSLEGTSGPLGPAATKPGRCR